jgi:hypothetical protein
VRYLIKGRSEEAIEKAIEDLGTTFKDTSETNLIQQQKYQDGLNKDFIDLTKETIQKAGTTTIDTALKIFTLRDNIKIKRHETAEKLIQAKLDKSNKILEELIKNGGSQSDIDDEAERNAKLKEDIAARRKALEEAQEKRKAKAEALKNKFANQDRSHILFWILIFTDVLIRAFKWVETNLVDPIKNFFADLKDSFTEIGDSMKEAMADVVGSFSASKGEDMKAEVKKSREKRGKKKFERENKELVEGLKEGEYVRSGEDVYQKQGGELIKVSETSKEAEVLAGAGISQKKKDEVIQEAIKSKIDDAKNDVEEFTTELKEESDPNKKKKIKAKLDDALARKSGYELKLKYYNFKKSKDEEYFTDKEGKKVKFEGTVVKSNDDETSSESSVKAEFKGIKNPVKLNTPKVSEKEVSKPAKETTEKDEKQGATIINYNINAPTDNSKTIIHKSENAPMKDNTGN